MKRLKIPRIQIRIPIPDIPGPRRSSKTTKDAPVTEAVLPITAETAPETKPLEQPQEAAKIEQSDKATPDVPLPSISKSSLRKPGVPKIPLPVISKPGAHKLSVPKILSLHKTKDKPAVPATSPAPQLEETKTTATTPATETKGKSKIKMPSLKLSKASMTSLSLGKGSAKSAGKHTKGSAKSAGKRILALSVEGTDIRLVSYRDGAIESWKSMPFEARFLKMGLIADPEGFGEVIKNAITGIETNKSYVICSLPGHRSVSRIISIPKVGKKEVDSVVPREVRRVMTVSEEDNYFHWQVLPSETDSAQTQVFLLAVPKEPVTLLLRSLSHAGLNPSNIDLKPLALMRAVNQKDAIIANCEGNSMELIIVSDDIPVLIRSVFLGEGVANQDYTIGRISDELGRTIVTYNEINKGRPLSQDVPVYLTGATAAGVPFALNVAALTGRTVQPLESPIPVPADMPVNEYMVNIGLILKVV